VQRGHKRGAHCAYESHVANLDETVLLTGVTTLDAPDSRRVEVFKSVRLGPTLAPHSNKAAKARLRQLHRSYRQVCAGKA